MCIYDFPAGPVLKIPHFQCRGLGQGIKIPYATWYSQKKKKTQEKKNMCVCVGVWWWWASLVAQTVKNPPAVWET